MVTQEKAYGDKARVPTDTHVLQSCSSFQRLVWRSFVRLLYQDCGLLMYDSRLRLLSISSHRYKHQVTPLKQIIQSIFL